MMEIWIQVLNAQNALAAMCACACACWTTRACLLSKTVSRQQSSALLIAFFFAIVRDLFPAGHFNEPVFRGIDYTLAQAGRYGLKVIVTLNTNWDFQDGIPGVGPMALHTAESPCDLLLLVLE